MASEVGAGAAQGAATGAVAGPWGALIGAAVGAIGGFMKGRAAKKEAERKKKAIAKLQGLATPAHLVEVTNTLNPLFRNIVESGLGPQFKQEIDSMLAKHGGTGTGAGEAMRTSAQAVPTLAANRMALDEATGVVGREMNAAAAEADLDAGTVNPLMEGLLGAARGYMAGGGIQKGAFRRTPKNTGATPSVDEKDPYSIYGSRSFGTGD